MTHETQPETKFLNIKLTEDQALVLSDWLDPVMHRPDFSALVDDRAVWSALFTICGSLETQLTSAIFDSSYGETLDAARRRLIGELGDFAETSGTP